MWVLEQLSHILFVVNIGNSILVSKYIGVLSHHYASPYVRVNSARIINSHDSVNISA